MKSAFMSAPGNKDKYSIQAFWVTFNASRHLTGSYQACTMVNHPLLQSVAVTLCQLGAHAEYKPLSSKCPRLYIQEPRPALI